MLQNITTFYDYLFIKLDSLSILFDYIYGEGAFLALSTVDSFQLLLFANIFFLLMIFFLGYIFIYMLRSLLARF